MNRFALLAAVLIPSLATAQSPAAASIPEQPQPAAEQRMLDEQAASVAAFPTPEQAAGPLPTRPLTPERFPHAPTTAAAASTGGWFGDLGFYVLHPRWSSGNPAFATLSVTAVPGGVETSFAAADFDHDGSFAPLVQLGYAGRNGLGIRARWWTLRSTENISAALDPGATGVSLLGPPLLGIGSDLNLTPGTRALQSDFRNRLSFDVIDLESLWDTRIGRSNLLLSAGVRYTHLGQAYTATAAAGDSTPGSDEQVQRITLNSSNTFSGAGPTVSLQGHRLIGQTNLSLYGLSRAAVLFGESRRRAASIDLEQVPDNEPDIISDSASLNNDSLRPVLELEVGGNWTRNVGAFDFFAETGLVGMVWFNTGNATNVDALLSDLSSTVADDFDQNLGLIGLRFSSGIRF